VESELAKAIKRAIPIGPSGDILGKFTEQEQRRTRFKLQASRDQPVTHRAFNQVPDEGAAVAACIP